MNRVAVPVSGMPRGVGCARALAVGAALCALAACGGDAALDRAEKAYDAGSYREAVTIIRHHVKKGGEKTPAMCFLLGKAWLRAGSEADAQLSFDDCRTADAGMAKEIAAFLKAEALAALDGGDLAKGKRLVQLALGYEPGLAFGKHDVVVGEIYADRRDYAAAVPYLERFVKDFPEDPRAAEALIDLAAAYEKLGASSRSIEVYKRFQERYPRSRLAGDAAWELENLLLREAESRVEAGAPAEAETVLVNLASTATSPIVVERSNFLLGQICEGRGDVQPAIRYYRVVVNAGTSGRLVEKAKERIEQLEMSKRRR